MRAKSPLMVLSFVLVCLASIPARAKAVYLDCNGTAVHEALKIDYSVRTVVTTDFYDGKDITDRYGKNGAPGTNFSGASHLGHVVQYRELSLRAQPHDRSTVMVVK